MIHAHPVGVFLMVIAMVAGKRQKVHHHLLIRHITVPIKALISLARSVRLLPYGTQPRAIAPTKVVISNMSVSKVIIGLLLLATPIARTACTSITPVASLRLTTTSARSVWQSDVSRNN